MYKISNCFSLKNCKMISIGCVLISIVAWIPTLCSILSRLWVLSVILSPIGFIMSLIGLCKYTWLKGILVAILNVIMFFSFFIVMYIGYNY
ncbi:hypothetical protein CLOHAE12215_00176 [Clostridium haemolyticum]|uniref:hypothetical protein n=1 Tax=Clostridium TaxID=1485 RepID=UPI00057C86C5|nr:MULTISPECIES: hypothetical protein [Clostridium]MCD3217251.1 hypothetical protein [Clostridium botulinum C]CAG7838809.1 hypothetical protein CLOHAE12215_00176 [Clostridium haemolyticum]